MSQPAQFTVGAPVRVSARNVAGHVRTPWYVRGRLGRIERICGRFGNPEELAYHRSGEPAIPLYRVRFRMADLWTEAETSADTLVVDIFEHWLENASDVRENS